MKDRAVLEANAQTIPEIDPTLDRELNVAVFGDARTTFAKRVGRDGAVHPAGRALLYDGATEIKVANFAAMQARLRLMLGMPHTHLVRGGLLQWTGGHQTRVRRLLYDTKEGTPASLLDVARRWLFLDVDDLDQTHPAVDWRDLRACGAAAVSRLPAEFAGRRYIVAATGSHGLPGKGARVRLVFLLDRAVSSAELRAWLGDRAGDASVFGPAQPVYTARPIREDGAADHVAERVMLVPGPPGTLVEVGVPPIDLKAPRPRASTGALPEGDLADLAAMVRATPNGPDFDGRSSWLSYGHALAATFGESELARELWSDWCARWKPKDRTKAADAERAEEGWDSILDAGEHMSGWWTLARAAERAGVPVPACVARLRLIERIVEAQSEFEATENLPPDGVPPPPVLSTANAAPLAVASSEDALALEFSRRHAGQVLHIANGHGWHVWAGHRWAQDERRAVFDLSRLACRDHAQRLVAEEQDALARKVSGAATRAAVLSMAASDPRHARSIHEFDADPWILNTPGGVIDLRTGAIRPHVSGELVTKSTPVAPSGECPTWLRFLDQATQGDGELAAYLKRWAGYSLTGSTVEQQFLFLYGPGGNGKSLIVQTLAAALGDYATSATPDVFTQTRSDQHLAHVAALKGARLVTAPETEEGKPWAEARLKSLVAADRQSARFMRADPFEFVPELKLWICGNHLPRLLNVDDAMRRRTRIVPLTHRPAAPDPFLAEKLKAELGGILAWAVQGCLEWRAHGLGLPMIVKEACADYFAEQDVFSAWIRERLDTADPNALEASRELFSDWREFAAARREEIRTETWFGAELQKHFVRRHTRTGKVFVGVKTRPRDIDFPI